ncbi:hypothetical protein BCR36DRAFT_398943 [Piromyces finnis]|uniref:Uncharacterized protein n=1 Tax=Piromyces finnis TaxID=1754191 RepID=A0A1Y1V3C1_9FUNG|nr:hypothetical protein BCR36DRAFT_398943 [Piromyces finnis]|eukprot:ORX46219.1 hypothetical protein BCR36DRAFT_398943 [Piromyces finnis]
MTSRYMKIIILNKQNLIKSNFLDINMKESKRKLSEPQYNENESNKQVYFIIEPNEFIKHYDDLITMKVTNIISASVFSIIFVLIIVVFFIAWDDLWGKCTSKSWIIFLPVMIATFFSLLFNIYTLLYSLKNLSSASYFFYSPFIFCIISCNIIPLVELFWSKYITKKKV